MISHCQLLNSLCFDFNPIHPSSWQWCINQCPADNTLHWKCNCSLCLISDQIPKTRIMWKIHLGLMFLHKPVFFISGSVPNRKSFCVLQSLSVLSSHLIFHPLWLHCMFDILVDRLLYFCLPDTLIEKTLHIFVHNFPEAHQILNWNFKFSLSPLLSNYESFHKMITLEIWISKEAFSSSGDQLLVPTDWPNHTNKEKNTGEK